MLFAIFSKSLLSLATDGKDGHGLTFEKVGPSFSSIKTVNCPLGCSQPAHAAP